MRPKPISHEAVNRVVIVQAFEDYFTHFRLKFVGAHHGANDVRPLLTRTSGRQGNIRFRTILLHYRVVKCPLEQRQRILQDATAAAWTCAGARVDCLLILLLLLIRTCTQAAACASRFKNKSTCIFCKFPQCKD